MFLRARGKGSQVIYLYYRSDKPIMLLTFIPFVRTDIKVPLLPIDRPLIMLGNFFEVQRLLYWTHRINFNLIAIRFQMFRANSLYNYQLSNKLTGRTGSYLVVNNFWTVIHMKYHEREEIERATFYGKIND